MNIRLPFNAFLNRYKLYIHNNSAITYEELYKDLDTLEKLTEDAIHYIQNKKVSINYACCSPIIYLRNTTENDKDVLRYILFDYYFKLLKYKKITETQFYTLFKFIINILLTHFDDILITKYLIKNHYYIDIIYSNNLFEDLLIYYKPRNRYLHELYKFCNESKILIVNDKCNVIKKYI